jgi:hypothetical protein
LINSDWLITKTHSALALHSRCTHQADRGELSALLAFDRAQKGNGSHWGMLLVAFLDVP